MAEDDHHGHTHEHKSKSLSKNVRLTVMLSLIFIFFIAEIVVGYLTHSLSLIADSFHMLSDFASLSVALFSVWVR